jgi:hypothetical protein
MPANIFSTYSTGENRVTASILAVLQALSLSRIERLLGALLEQSEFELVRFQNQPAKGGEGIPDAIILSSCRLLIETKIRRNALNRDQIKRHLKRLQDAAESDKRLLLLTPDDQRPPLLDTLPDSRIAWAPFAALDQAIDELLRDPHEVVSEREAFLLRELQAMLVRERLLVTESDVVVVPARDAWPEYQEYSAYVCQPDRAFQPVTRIGFYSQGRIYPLVPKILATHERVEFQFKRHPGELGKLVDRLLKETPRSAGKSYKVLFLSAPDDKQTVRLEQPIVNDLTTEDGRTTAFTQNQRYVSLAALRKATKT